MGKENQTTKKKQNQPKPKHPGGRPVKYKCAQDLKEKIEDYFESCWMDKVIENTDKDGNVTTTNIRYQDRPYTVAGLAHYLGFNSRNSLLNYEAKPEFLRLIKSAKLKIEMNIEERLIDGKNAAGPIFWLKNHADYKDKSEIDHRVSGVKELLEEIDGVTLGLPSQREK